MSYNQPTFASADWQDRLRIAIRMANRIMPRLSPADKLLFVPVPVTAEWSDEDIELAAWNAVVDTMMELKPSALFDYDQMFCEYPIDAFVSNLVHYQALRREMI
jgi:hypothetical protein